MSKPCPVCGPLGRYGRYTLGHTATCTPALRALVLAAEKCEREWDPKLGEVGMGKTNGDKALHRAVRRFKKERGK